MQSGFIVNHPADFDYAVHLKKHIDVWLQGQLICSGVIERHTEESVTILGEKYIKAFCEFKVR